MGRRRRVESTTLAFALFPAGAQLISTHPHPSSGVSHRCALVTPFLVPATRRAVARSTQASATQGNAGKDAEGDAPPTPPPVVDAVDVGDSGDDEVAVETKEPEKFDASRVYIDPVVRDLEEKGTKLYYESLEVNMDALKEREDVAEYIERRVRRRRSRGGSLAAIEAAPKPVRWAITKIEREKRKWHVEVVWSVPPLTREGTATPTQDTQPSETK